ncbi:MAG TPA: formate dehydrogenase accessory protein FdhE [Dokdonella sp.]|uniref:formate dehydrogenase accessory protein FdhE n=1 Tax=Dokdonella sp. TaxID=2291710 RepID=UPI002BC4DCD4|nr:formate dehydrogenase accessory protein FdhE [Dokdonella sp.]HUD41718.1 formate dehydrogenase accessory protein FdhE [Dokdonella sp.]
MTSRILEPGQIETLAQRSIPRIRLPDRDTLFAQRAERFEALAAASPIGAYLRLQAAVARAQHAALAQFPGALPTPAQRSAAQTHRMPPMAAAAWPRAPAWRDALAAIGRAVAALADCPVEVARLGERVAALPADEAETQADRLLGAREGAVDTAAAPLLMAALQVHWTAASSRLVADEVQPLDVPGLCPLCGMPPVASIVRAQAPYRGYRYLHCALCACEWHLVRVQCSQCGASGKDVAYRSLVPDGETGESAGALDPAVRAETCEQCRCYRKIVYQEKDPGVDPVADDLASLALDLLLAEHGYARASGHPLLWQADTDGAR